MFGILPNRTQFFKNTSKKFFIYDQIAMKEF